VTSDVIKYTQLSIMYSTANVLSHNSVM